MAVFAERDNLDRQQLALKYSQLNGIFEGKDGREYNSEYITGSVSRGTSDNSI